MFLGSTFQPCVSQTCVRYECVCVCTVIVSVSSYELYELELLGLATL